MRRWVNIIILLLFAWATLWGSFSATSCQAAMNTTPMTHHSCCATPQGCSHPLTPLSKTCCRWHAVDVHGKTTGFLGQKSPWTPIAVNKPFTVDFSALAPSTIADVTQVYLPNHRHRYLTLQKILD